MSNYSETVRNRLTELGIRPSKGLGQNFLIAGSAYHKIMAAADIKRGETVVEIGPGLGTLTEELTATGAKVLAVEKDRKLISFLQDLFKSNPEVTIIEGDALQTNPSDLNLLEND